MKSRRNTNNHSLVVRLWTQRVLAILDFVVICICSKLIGNILPAVCAFPICGWLFLTRSVDWDWTFDSALSRWAEKENR